MTIPSKFRLYLAGTMLALLISCSDNPSLKFPTEAEVEQMYSHYSSSSSSEFSSSSEPSSSSSVPSSSSFSALPSSSSFINERGTFIDTRDKKTYNWVKIGDQVWMAQNLNYNLSVNAVCHTKDENCSCGMLYTWIQAMALNAPKDNCDEQYCTGKIETPHNGMCLEGWHIPTKEEWETLISFSNKSANNLKATSGWGTNNGYDQYGFAALPCGEQDSLSYGTKGIWWTTAEDNPGSFAYQFMMDENNDVIDLKSNSKKFNFSVRCIKDN